jgi:UDP-GlcNAc:undecaprenyl-phosphate GlcNAc-1-phosphate transferase
MDNSILLIKNLSMILILIVFCYACLKNSFFIGNLLGLIDIPNKRKIHLKNIPNFGGLLFVICSIILSLFLYLTNQLKINLEDLIIINIASVMIFLVGFYDDIKNVSPYKRIIFFFILLLVIFKNQNLLLSELYFKNFFIPKISIFNWSILFTIFCLFLFYNSFNFSDGANGIALSSAIIYLSYLLIKINNIDLYIFFNLIILILIFLYNINNKIFIGNSGSSALSIFLGLIYIYFYNTTSNLFADQIALLFLIPGLDMIRVTIQRLLLNKNPFFPDQSHLHHLLMNFIEKKIVWVFYSFINLIPILFYEIGFSTTYIFFFSFILFFLLIYYLKKKNI